MKNRYKKMSARSRGIMTIFVILGITGLGSAIWLLSYNSGMTGYSVSSTTNLVFSDGFTIEAVDTTNSSYSKTENLSINNVDGQYPNLYVDFNTTIEDNAGDSCDNAGDVTVLVEYDGVELTSGDNITIDSGNSEIYVTTDLKQFSCPQNISTQIALHT